MTQPFRALGSALLILTAACSGGGGGSGTGPEPPPPDPCTFTNPLGPGADPWVVRHQGAYYWVESRQGGIWVFRSERLTDVHQNGIRVWTPPPSGWNASHLWAPELHFLDGRWYIYYAAGRAGPPYIHQRSGVLESVGADPQGSYVDRGQLYTGDGEPGEASNVWAIDLTVSRIGGQLYAVWSGWEENRATDRTPQHLYIARMANPTTLTGPRVRISSPVESWERGTELDLNEGPEFLVRNGETFIVYSTRESWLREYRLGQLRLRGPGADPMDPASWIKSGPVFQGTERVYGVGHASFTTSPDGKEDWIVYHSKISTDPGWTRAIHTQRFGWKADGSPDFGIPVAPQQRIRMPSGQCAG